MNDIGFIVPPRRHEHHTNGLAFESFRDGVVTSSLNAVSLFSIFAPTAVTHTASDSVAELGSDATLTISSIISAASATPLVTLYSSNLITQSTNPPTAAHTDSVTTLAATPAPTFIPATTASTPTFVTAAPTLTSTNTTSSAEARAGTDVTRSQKLIAPIVGTVIPLLFIIFAVVLFCWWWKAKRGRERELDDLERSAVWVTSPRDGKSSNDDLEPTTERESGDGQIRTSMEQDVIDQDEPLTPGTIVRSPKKGSSSLDSSDDQSSVSSSIEDPFISPVADIEDRFTASQIGLALTTDTSIPRLPDISPVSAMRTPIRCSSNPFKDIPNSNESSDTSVVRVGRFTATVSPAKLGTKESCETTNACLSCPQTGRPLPPLPDESVHDGKFILDGAVGSLQRYR